MEQILDKNRQGNVIKPYYPAILLVLLFITEAYSKIVHFSFGETPVLLQVTKGLILAGFGSYILINQPRYLWLLGGLFVSFLIGQFSLLNSVSKEAGITFIKLIYPLVLLLFFNTYRLSDKQKKALFLVFELIMLVNSIIIGVGLLFNIHFFSSYLYGSRFGFNGLFITSATGSYVYCLTLIYLLTKYKKAIFKRIPNLIIIAAMFYVGTKVSYLFLGCFFATYFWKYSRLSKKMIVSLLLVMGMLGLYVFFFKYGIFNKIRQEDGLLSSLMSYRNDLLLEHTLPYIQEHWGLFNYLFGGISDITTKSQIEFIDIFYILGVFGGLLYYYIFYKVFLVVKVETHIAILLLAVFIIVLFAGNFFSYPSIAIYLIVLREYLKLDKQNQHI